MILRWCIPIATLSLAAGPLMVASTAADAAATAHPGVTHIRPGGAVHGFVPGGVMQRPGGAAASRHGIDSTSSIDGNGDFSNTWLAES
jgi:hypothetical protein